MLRIGLALTLISLAGCAHSSNANNQDLGIRASYVWGPEVNTMKPCGSDSTFWVLAKPAVIGQLRAGDQRLFRSDGDPRGSSVVAGRMWMTLLPNKRLKLAARVD